MFYLFFFVSAEKSLVSIVKITSVLLIRAMIVALFDSVFLVIALAHAACRSDIYR